eukprot:3269103-Rhodomonas_salina.1
MGWVQDNSGRVCFDSNFVLVLAYPGTRVVNEILSARSDSEGGYPGTSLTQEFPPHFGCLYPGTGYMGH